MFPKKTNNAKLLSSIKSFFFHDSNQKHLFYKNFIYTYNLAFFKKKLEQKNLILFSPNELRFNNLIHFKTTALEFSKIYGKPNFSETDQTNSEIKTLVFKTKIAGIGSRCNLIFHKEKLVLFNYVFTELTKQERINLLDYSVEKYGNKLNGTNYQIMDSSQNSLFIEYSKNSLVFNFYAPAKTLKRTFDSKPKEKKVISFKDTLKAENSAQN